MTINHSPECPTDIVVTPNAVILMVTAWGFDPEGEEGDRIGIAVPFPQPN